MKKKFQLKFIDITSLEDLLVPLDQLKNTQEITSPIKKDTALLRDAISEMDEDLNKGADVSALQNSSEALLSVQRLDFKMSFLEAVEELRMRREAEIHHEEQISKFVIEKQELEWQKATLHYQIETLNKQHTEAMTAFKNQFQARIFAVEEEKGRYLLAEKSKQREIEGLKETLKTLQILKYTLENKLNEMEQTLQLHILAKEDHRKSLNEVEKCYEVITCQFGTIKGAYEKLEQNVEEAIQLNKKLTAVNKRQESEIDNLKQELKKVTADLIRSNVTSQHREENFKLTTKELELQKLQQKLSVETELKTKITEVNEQLRKEKQEIVTSVQHMQQLLCRQTETNLRMDIELNELKEKYQTLERDNELQREKAKENEEKFLNLQHEYEKAQATRKNEVEQVSLKNEMHTSQKENKCTQTTTDVSNHDLENMRVKNTITCSLGSDEMHIEQNHADTNKGETNSICVEDLTCLGNCENEDNMVCLCKENQAEASEGKPLCTLSFTTPEVTSGSWDAECEKAAANEKEDQFLVDEIHAREEIKPPDSCHSMVSVKEPKMLLETVVSKTNENINNASHEVSLTSEPLTEESKEEHKFASEKSTNNQLKTKVYSVILSETIQHNQFTFCSDGLQQSSDISKAGKMSPFHSTDCITSKIHSSKQASTFLEEIPVDDPSKNNKCHELNSTYNISEDITQLHASFYNRVDLNIHVTRDENTNNMPLERNLNANAEKVSKGFNINEMPSKQLDEDSLRLPRMSTNTLKHTNEVLPLSTENVSESQATDLKADQITRNEPKELHASKIICDPFLAVSDKETTLLKDKEESLCSTVTGEMTEEENTEDLYSLSIKTSGDLLNGKSSFDLPSKDKTVKNSACLDLLRGCQGESQILAASTSKMPLLLKEQLCTQEIQNTRSRNTGENTNMNGAEKTEKTASKGSNRVADTLNTGSINPSHKRNPTDEWNAIAKAFYEPYFPTENLSCLSPWTTFGKLRKGDGLPKEEPTTTWLLQDVESSCTQRKAKCNGRRVKAQCPSGAQQKSSQLTFEGTAIVLNESLHSSEEKDCNSQNVFIRTKLNNIEKFLYLKKFCPPRKRKYEDNPENAMRANKAEI